MASGRPRGGGVRPGCPSPGRRPAPPSITSLRGRGATRGDAACGEPGPGQPYSRSSARGKAKAKFPVPAGRRLGGGRGRLWGARLPALRRTVRGKRLWRGGRLPPRGPTAAKMTSPEPFGSSADEMERLEEELKKWKERVEKAEKKKADLLQCKLSADEECVKAEKELIELKDFKEKQQKDIAMSRGTHQKELHLLNQENAELKREIEKLKEDLAECRSALLRNGQIKKKVAEMKMEFSHLEDVRDDYPDTDTRCVFAASTKIPFGLSQNHALLTFEDEKVAQRLIKMGKHTVNLDSKIADVSVKPFTLEMGIKFELYVTISGTKINVSEVPELSIPEDWMRDKLELNFYKPKQGGGGEIEDVSYNKWSRTAIITFLRPGAANGFVSCTKYPFFVNGRCYRLSVSPNINGLLKKFQLYCGVSKKTILLKGIQETEDDEESIQDMIEIHFQKPSNHGGEIENIKYVSKGITWVCFEEDI